jgi:D-beta-D-heptose 7-phosphate kinase/D-beta-D-heptose 1-phosphate adenosyltransferase
MEARRLMDTLHVQCTGLFNYSSKNTTAKIRLMADRQQLSRVDIESCGFIDKKEEKKIIKKIIEDSVNNSAQGLIISDYSKGAVTPGVCREVIAFCKQKGIPVLVDPKGTNWEKYRGASLIKPNFKEFKAYCGLEHISLEKLPELMKKTMDQLELDMILVTLGSLGMAGIDEKGNYSYLPTSACEVFDVSGAGDTVAAVLVSSLLAGASLEDAMVIANNGAGIVVSKTGTCACTNEELLNTFRDKDSKLVSLPQIMDFTKKQKNLGRKIVFTNGCFDLFHAGHILFLQEAAKAGDYLIVAVNDDLSVKRLKGKKRPIINLENRIKLIESMECVDFVMVFSEDTPNHLIEKIGPNVLVKGGNYKENEVMGRQEAIKSGGEVKIINLENHITAEQILKEISG